MADRAERTSRLRGRAKHRARMIRERGTPRLVLAPARLAVRPALAFGSGLRQTVRYWRSERRTLRQGWVALSVTALGNVPTGVILGVLAHRLEAMPGLIILIFGGISLRGAIFGALASRLSTSMNAGLLRFSADREGVLMQNVGAATLQTFTSSLYLGVMAWVFSGIAGLPAIPVWDLIAISVLGGVLASAVVLAFTVAVAQLGQRRDWDLDAVAAPTITLIGDLVTLPSLMLASLVALRGAVSTTIGVACAVVAGIAAISAIRTDLPTTRRIVAESAPTLAIGSTISIFAGLAIEHRLARFTLYPALFILLPSFLSNAGALGGIVSSRLGSKLHLGAVRPRLLPERLALLDASLAGPWAFANFALVGVLAHATSLALDDASPGLGTMVLVSVIGGLIATLAASIVAYATAIWTFRHDLDPDNHGIAAVTSTMDLVGVGCLLAAISMTGAIP